VTIEIGSGSFVPGFEEQMEGMAKGETREIDVTFPANERRGDIAGRPARFQVTLQETKRKVVPPIDDELAKDVGGFESLDALRRKVREDLEGDAAREALQALREQAREALATSNPVDAPPALVEREFRSMVEGMRRRLAAQGVSMDQLGFSPEALEKDWRSRAETSVRASLILEQIARDEGITVGSEAIDARIQDMARETRQTPRAVRQAYEERGLIPVLESRLKEEKALDLVLETATMQAGDRAQDAAVKAKKKVPSPIVPRAYGDT
jgi:trigger factor